MGYLRFGQLCVCVFFSVEGFPFRDWRTYVTRTRASQLYAAGREVQACLVCLLAPVVEDRTTHFSSLWADF